MLILAACPAYPFFLFILRIHPSYPARTPPRISIPRNLPHAAAHAATPELPCSCVSRSPAPASPAPLLLHRRIPVRRMPRARNCCNAAMLLLQCCFCCSCCCNASAAFAASAAAILQCCCDAAVAMLQAAIFLLQCWNAAAAIFLLQCCNAAAAMLLQCCGCCGNTAASAASAASATKF